MIRSFRSACVVAVAAVMLTAMGCSQWTEPTGSSATAVQQQSKTAQTPRKVRPPRGQYKRLSAEKRAQVDAAKARISSVGRAHRDAMRDLRANMAKFSDTKTRKLTSRSVMCAELLRITLKYGSEINIATGESISPMELGAEARAAVANNSICRDASAPANLLVPKSAFLPRSATAPMLDPDSVTVAIFDYTSWIIEISNDWDGVYTGDVSSQLDDVLAYAVGELSSSDFNAVASAASLAASSAQDWNDEGNYGGFDEDQYGNPVSLLAWRVNWRMVGTVTAVDAAGCVSSMADVVTTAIAANSGPVGWGYLALKCGIWAVPASGATYVGYRLMM